MIYTSLRYSPETSWYGCDSRGIHPFDSKYRLMRNMKNSTIVLGASTVELFTRFMLPHSVPRIVENIVCSVGLVDHQRNSISCGKMLDETHSQTSSIATEEREKMIVSTPLVYFQIFKMDE